MPDTVALDRNAVPAPRFSTSADVPATARGWLRAQRAEIARVEDAGGRWHQPFDDLHDADCRAVGADGAAQPALRVVGPPSVGTFGDRIGAMYIGAMYIGAKIHRMLPDALACLAASRASIRAA